MIRVAVGHSGGRRGGYDKRDHLNIALTMPA